MSFLWHPYPVFELTGGGGLGGGVEPPTSTFKTYYFSKNIDPTDEIPWLPPPPPHLMTNRPLSLSIYIYLNYHHHLIGLYRDAFGELIDKINDINDIYHQGTGYRCHRLPVAQVTGGTYRLPPWHSLLVAQVNYLLLTYGAKTKTFNNNNRLITGNTYRLSPWHITFTLAHVGVGLFQGSTDV